MVARDKEVSELIELYNRQSAELVAVYGRRRVGKTYLVDETFKGRITFRHAGLSPVEMGETSGKHPVRQQLQAFYYSLLTQGMKREHVPSDWLEAFFMLEKYLQTIDDGSRQLIFFDELPWMDTPKSGFITAFEAFWNGWACHRNVMVIVAGSATSWIMDKLINNHGGLYGRVTYEIKLEPFTLKECELLFTSRGIHFSRYDIVQSYMIFGGIPFYLNYIMRGKSLAQNVDELFFQKGAKLRMEYDRLFSSIFKNPDMMKKVVKALSMKNRGLTRQEISSYSGYSEGGTLTQALNALIASDFVIRYNPLESGKREEYYKLSDPFCIFYLRFVVSSDQMPDGFWQQNISTQAIITWRGYAFENVCFNHVRQIKHALGISGISTTQSAWTKIADDEQAAQIDLIITRSDNIVNMCEIKFYSDVFAVDRKYDLLLRNRRNMLGELISKKMGIHSTLITTYGIKENKYRWAFDNVIVMDDLFAE
ncbi:MAG: ATP-binding protein [Eubacterium sp.]|nr:ATP-binding protein [Eubacterium sp.]